MLREEMLVHLNALKHITDDSSMMWLALDMAIKALEQEPCEDAISRDELLKAMDTWDKFGYTETGCFVREPKNNCVKYIHYDDVIKCIKGMPPVTPQPKTEHWIYTGDYITEGMLKCSSCGYKHDVADRFLYCPNCGAKMAESEEHA